MKTLEILTHQSAYHGAGFAYRDTLSKNITQPTGRGLNAYATTNSEVVQTSLLNSDTSFALPDFPTRVEQEFSNIILSLAAQPSLYSQVNVTGPCTMSAAVLKWDYEPFWLVLSYSLAAGVSLIAISVGIYAFKANGYSADTNFSTFLTTTRNQSLDRLSKDSYAGQISLSKDFMKSKLSFNEFDGFTKSYVTDRGGTNDGDENIERTSESAKGRLFGVARPIFFSILAFVLAIVVMAVAVGVVEGLKSASSSTSSATSSVSGANVTNCAQDEYTFYVGAINGPCYRINGTDGFEVNKLESTCSVTVYSDISCSYNATASDIGQCHTGFESFSVDGCS